jgi:outer membrane protein assembly factor BamD
MNKIISKTLFSIFIFLLFSCNEYQKLLRNDDVKIKYEMAEKYYENQEWRRASVLFEQIQPKYRGKPQGERITFFYANSLLKKNNYVLAAFQFESFVKSYPISQKAEEASFLSAYCYYKQSPKYSLAQDDTNTAIQKLQNFINFYPYSERLDEANDLVQELRIKLEFKAFEIAKQYNTIRDYTSAIKVLNNFISEYPGTPYRENALYYLFDSSYQLAINSIQSKRLERLNNAIKLYDELIKDYPETKFFGDSKKKMNDIDKEIAIFATDKS